MLDCLEKTDVELVEMTLKDADCFTVLIQRYEQKLFKYIRRLTSVPVEDVEDLLQEVFIKVYKNLNGFDDDLSFSSWVYRIARNHVISNYRKFKNMPKKIYFDETNDVFERLASELDIEGEVDKKILTNKVRELLGQLDDKYREVLVLNFLEDKSYAEISDILKKPMGSVATLISRAKNKFRQLLKENNVTL